MSPVALDPDYHSDDEETNPPTTAAATTATETATDATTAAASSPATTTVNYSMIELFGSHLGIDVSSLPESMKIRHTVTVGVPMTQAQFDAAIKAVDLGVTYSLYLGEMRKNAVQAEEIRKKDREFHMIAQVHRQQLEENARLYERLFKKQEEITRLMQEHADRESSTQRMMTEEIFKLYGKIDSLIKQTEKQQPTPA